MRTGLTETERFETHFDRSVDGCWLWTGSLKKAGYGTFFVQRGGAWKAVNAHRYAYALWVGPIPDGMQIDHLCVVPACVRPDHLEVVTQQENLRRKSQRILARSHCVNGHEYAVVGRYANGKCPACTAIRNKRNRKTNLPPVGERTHCPQGHPYEGANLRLVKTPSGTGRRCRTCDNLRNAEQYQKRKARRAA